EGADHQFMHPLPRSEEGFDHLHRRDGHIPGAEAEDRHAGDQDQKDPQKGDRFFVHQQGDPSQAKGKITAHNRLNPLRAMYTKKGVPIKAVMAPTGTSLGMMTYRAPMSARSSRIAPSRAL